MGIVDADKRCVRCLGKNHASADCRRAQPCRTCGEPHHTALCPETKIPAPATTTTRDSTVVAPTLAATAQVFGDIFLKKATVLIDASSGPRRAICWHGPHWLGRSEEDWQTATSTNRDENIMTQIDEEAKRSVTVAAVTQQDAAIE